MSSEFAKMKRKSYDGVYLKTKVSKLRRAQKSLTAYHLLFLSLGATDISYWTGGKRAKMEEDYTVTGGRQKARGKWNSCGFRPSAEHTRNPAEESTRRSWWNQDLKKKRKRIKQTGCLDGGIWVRGGYTPKWEVGGTGIGGITESFG